MIEPYQLDDEDGFFGLVLDDVVVRVNNLDYDEKEGVKIDYAIVEGKPKSVEILEQQISNFVIEALNDFANDEIV